MAEESHGAVEVKSLYSIKLAGISSYITFLSHGNFLPGVQVLNEYAGNNESGLLGKIA
jgi:hypothetical protein